MDKITQMLENVVRCKYFEVGVHIKNPIKNSYQDGLGRTAQTMRELSFAKINAVIAEICSECLTQAFEFE
jgi:hypothetical protein